MGKVTLKLTRNGPRQLRRQPSVAADLKQRADQIAARAGPGMEPSVEIGANRARASVITATPEARRAEAVDRALTRAIGLTTYTTRAGKTRTASQAQVDAWMRSRKW